MGQDLVKHAKVSGSYETLPIRNPNGLKCSGNSCKFSDSEIRNLVKFFNSLASLSPEDNFINTSTFEHYFPLGGILANRLFVAFDKNKNGVIDLQEFIDGMALCLQGSVDDKCQIAFEMFDLDGSNSVSAYELYVVLKSVLMTATRSLDQSTVMPNNQVYPEEEVNYIAECIVQDAFNTSELNGENKMNLKVFKSWMEHHPFVLDSIFGQTCLKDKRLQQYRRLGEESNGVPAKSSSSVKKQTWVNTKSVDEDLPQNAPCKSSFANADYLWSPVFPQMTAKPSKRCKLAACLAYDSIYIYGGRGVCASLKDLWRYDIGENAWFSVPDTSSNRPSYLQGHTLLSYKNNLVLYGGEFTSSNETPLWLFNLNTFTWSKPSGKQNGPINRRGHSAVISGDSLYVFGGYVDLRGASGELWKYDFTSNIWTSEKSRSNGWPRPRYHHSATVFDKSMVIFGGLEDMQYKNDMWLWNMAARKWTKVKGRNPPPPLFGHAAVKVGDGLLVFGGESSDGTQFNTMWRFNFESRSWSTVMPKGMISPPPRSHHSIVQIPDFLFSSLRPTSSHSAPPCTPAYDRDLPKLEEENLPPTPVTSTQLNTENRSNLNSMASLGSLDSTGLLSHTDEELTKVRLNPNASGSLDSIVTKVVLHETENMSMVNQEKSFSQEDLVVRRECLTDDVDHFTSDRCRLVKPCLDNGQRLQPVRQQMKPGRSAECLSQGYKDNLRRLAQLSQNRIRTGVVNLMVLGGVSKGGSESFDRSIDMWKCQVDPVKQEGSTVQRIEVKTAESVQYNPKTSYNSDIAYVNLSVTDVANENCSYDTDDNGDIDDDEDDECVLMDISEGDTKSVNMLITDVPAGTKSLAQISI